ncbi:cyclic peptide export ABC transporter [Chondromyces crocatus]|uniref:Cyclic peptide transporter n=1 Tax=Chondromyces crocatus TaxID=52 RepID=A0A0K1EBY9_CHOCO|nr:cyclic peptide export ABC transporter [Chondromyces crocatus]AKT38406.1 uncharacterized protein CMC5_025520 [Chondromyces crocatus]
MAEHQPGSLSDNVASLWSLVRSGPGEGRRQVAIDLAIAAISDVIVLYSINEVIRVYRDGGFPTREMFLFGVAASASIISFARVLRVVSQSYNRVLSRMTLQILDKTRHVDLAQFEALGGASILARLTTDVDRVLGAGALLMGVLKSAGLVILAFLYFMMRSVEAAVFGFGALALLTAMTVHKGATLRKGFQRAEVVKAELLAIGAGLVRGIKQVKVHRGRREAILADVREHATKLSSEQAETFRRYYAEDALGFAFFFSLQAFIVIGFPILFSTDATTTGELVMTVWYISGAMGMVFKNQPELAAASAALARVRALESQLDASGATPATAATAATAAEPAIDDHLVEGFTSLGVHGLTYRYRTPGEVGAPRRGFQVGPLEATIPRGDIVFVTGNNGSGKSTFLKLLTGLYAPDAGTLSCDGHTLPRVAPEAYRNLFGVILSDFVVFERLYGMEDVDPARVTALLEEMEIAHKVSFAAGRFSTVELSTGQRKRLAMVVALLQDRPILVLDEWAADQDPAFRATFYRKLLPALKRKGKTVIAVTHDEQYFSVADRRLAFRDGKLVSEA